MNCVHTLGKYLISKLVSGTLFPKLKSQALVRYHMNCVHTLSVKFRLLYLCLLTLKA